MTSESKLVPAKVRQAVYDRDTQCCRGCGRFCDTPGLHHISYRSEGGGNTIENLVTIGWTPFHDCHLNVVHRHKKLWQPILETVIARQDGINGLQLLRWARA